jgi:hypothetical protein
VKRILTLGELNRVVKFIDGLNMIGSTHSVTLDSMSELFLTIDGQDTPLVILNNSTDEKFEDYTILLSDT